MTPNSLNPRRVFLLRSAAAATTLVATLPAGAQSRRVEESDETAVQLGYRHDSSKVDTARFPQHKADQHCANCGFWQGSAGDEWAGCSMFGRKQIKGTGWCAAWRKI